MKKFKKIYIEITNMCNLNCSFCPKDNLPKKEMSLEEFETILKKLDDYTDYVYLHVKGEPLLHSKFDEIINLCNKYNKQVNITTNGTLIKKQINSLKSVRQINVSLQSITNLDILDDIINSCNILSDNTYISYRYWVKNKYEDIIRTKIKPSKNIFISEGEEFIWPNLNNDFINTKGTCKALKDHIAILVDGTIVPCCLDSKGVINLGNIFNNSLEDVINSNRYINMLKGFNENILCESLCQKCGYKKNID